MVNLSIKNVPDALAAKLRERAARNHRSLQGELMAMLEGAVSDPNVGRANADNSGYEIDSTIASAEDLMERLAVIAGNRGIDTTQVLTREQAHDRKAVRKAGTPSKRTRPVARFAALRGTRKSGMTTDELMSLLRGYDEDARDPGFKNRKK